MAWTPGALNPLLSLVAEDKTMDVIITSNDFSWLYHPYDGGADVFTADTGRRDEVRRSYRDWLPL